MKKMIKKITPHPLIDLYWKMMHRYRLRRSAKNALPIGDFKTIPIVINNYNRLGYLNMLIEALEKRGYSNIYIIDNASTYPPLLEYYEKCPYEVIRLGENVGYLSFWKAGVYKKFKNRYFVYTDPDVVPIAECPDDFMKHFWEIMQRHKDVVKVGFSLKIDDLPDYFLSKENVIHWEERFWKKKIEDDIYDGYEAMIDTTFALYRPNSKYKIGKYAKSVRTAHPYTMKHMPWYINETQLEKDEWAEERYYRKSLKTHTHWSGLEK